MQSNHITQIIVIVIACIFITHYRYYVADCCYGCHSLIIVTVIHVSIMEPKPYTLNLHGFGVQGHLGLS